MENMKIKVKVWEWENEEEVKTWSVSIFANELQIGEAITDKKPFVMEYTILNPIAKRKGDFKGWINCGVGTIDINYHEIEWIE